MEIEKLEAKAREAQEIFDRSQGEWWATYGKYEVSNWQEAGANPDSRPNVSELMDRARMYAWKRVILHFRGEG